MRLTMRERRAVINAIAKRYQHSSKKGRGVILDEFIHTTGYSRKHAAWVLTNWLRKKVFTIGGRRTIYVFGLKKSKAKGKNPPKRPATYGTDIVRLLKILWAIAGGLCGKRLAPFLRDVVLLVDIQLSDGLSFSIFDAVDVRVPVIFTTAYDQYAIKAFKLNSIDYLLKPIRKEELQASLQKYRSLKGAYGIDFEEIIRAVRGQAPTYKKRFLIQYAQKIRKVETEDIAYFYALEKGVFLVTIRKETLPADYTLDKLEGLLDPAEFFRINRKMIVAFKAIRHMIPYSRARIKIELEPPEPATAEALVSVERSAAFKVWMDK